MEGNLVIKKCDRPSLELLYDGTLAVWFAPNLLVQMGNDVLSLLELLRGKAGRNIGSFLLFLLRLGLFRLDQP